MTWRRPARSQAGYTLVELIITLAIGVTLMSALVSVLYTTWQANNIATSRVEASNEMRNFQQFAYDDFAQANVTTLNGCTQASPCSTPITLPSVTYTWDGSNFLDRATNVVTTHAASNVTAFSWYVDTNSTVVVSLSVTIEAYSLSQTFRFWPRLNP